ncbi:MAG: PH domain-containing protein [Candidatus Hydrogenedentes bacterium]|nr:PH domain-containing protein [Candidatus Hydrogenedentota bacterium]
MLFYYFLTSLLSGPLFPIVFLPLLFRYETLRYTFDEDGISARWGFLFRREINLTYRRLQDIHLSKNIVQRWLGLATVHLQTASGSATPELSIEGIIEADELRDYLYSRMRGGRDETANDEGDSKPSPVTDDEALSLLHEIRDLLRSMAANRGRI